MLQPDAFGGGAEPGQSAGRHEPCPTGYPSLISGITDRASRGETGLGAASRTALQSREGVWSSLKRLTVSPNRLERFCAATVRAPWGRCACLVALLVVLCTTSLIAQESRAAERSVSTSRVNWSGSESGGALADLAASEFMGMLERHASLDRYTEVPAAGLKLSHYAAAFKLDLPVIRQSRLRLFADLGLGATRIRSRKLGLFSEASADVSEMYLSVRGGLTIEIDLSSDFSAFLSGREFVYLDADDQLVLEEFGRGNKILESGYWTFPLTVGLRIGLD